MCGYSLCGDHTQRSLDAGGAALNRQRGEKSSSAKDMLKYSDFVSYLLYLFNKCHWDSTSGTNRRSGWICLFVVG